MLNAPGWDSSLTPAGAHPDTFNFRAAPLVLESQGHDFVVVADPDLLFHGQYQKVGGDLKLTGGDGHSALIHDYFNNDKRIDLVSRDGARITGDVVEILAGTDHPGHYAQSTAPTPGTSSIGRVVAVTGSATVVRNGVAINLNMGDSIYKNDVIQTGSNSTLGIVLTDTSTFQLTANARMVLNELIYDPSGTANSAVVNLVQGTISFVAGRVAKTGDMRVETPSANLGIRGTAVIAEINATDGTTRVSVVVEQNGEVGSFQMFDKATGVLIGTVNQAGLVTTISMAGIGQIAQTVTEPKALADIQLEQALVQQLFRTYSLGVQTPQNDHPGSKGSPTFFTESAKLDVHIDGQPDVFKVVITGSQPGGVTQDFSRIDIPKPTNFVVAVALSNEHPAPIVTAKPGDSSVGYLGKSGSPFGSSADADSEASLTVSGTGTVVETDLSDVVTISIAGLVHTGKTGSLTEAQLLHFLSVTPGVITDGIHVSNQYQWVFQADPGTFDFLCPHDVLTLSYTIHPSDLYPASTNGDGVITINILGHDNPYVTVLPPPPETADQDVDSAGQKFLNTGSAEHSFTRAGTVIENDTADNAISVHVVGVTHTGPTSGKTDADFLSYFSVSSLTPLVFNPGSGQFHWTFDFLGAGVFALGATEMLTLSYTIRPDDQYQQFGIGDGVVTIQIEPPPSFGGPGDTGGGDMFLLDHEGPGAPAYHRTSVYTVNEPDLDATVHVRVSDVTWQWTNPGDLSAYLSRSQLLALLTVPGGAISDGDHVSNTFDIDFNAGVHTFDFLGDTSSDLTLIYTLLPNTDLFGDSLGSAGTWTINIHGHHLPETASVAGIDSAGSGFIWPPHHPNTVLTGLSAIYEPDGATRVGVELAGVTHSGPIGDLTESDLESFFIVPNGQLVSNPAHPNDGQLGDNARDDGHGDYHWQWTFDVHSTSFDFLTLGQTLVLKYQTHPVDLDYTGDPTSNSDGTTTFTIVGTSNMLVNGDFEQIDTTQTAAYHTPGSLVVMAHPDPNPACPSIIVGASVGWTSDDFFIPDTQWPDDFYSLTHVGDNFYTVVSDVGDGTMSPTHLLALGANAPLLCTTYTTVSQVVQGTQAGTHYSLDFWLTDNNPDQPSDFNVVWGLDLDNLSVINLSQLSSESVYNEETDPLHLHPFTHYYIDLEADGPDTTVGFYTGHANGVWLIDDVSLTPELANGTIHFSDDDPGLHGVTQHLSNTVTELDEHNALHDVHTDLETIGHFSIDAVDEVSKDITWHYTVDQTHVAGITFLPYELNLFRDTDVVTIQNTGTGGHTDVTLDVQIGTLGSDTFKFDASVNIETITNFSHQNDFGNDKIDLRAVTSMSFDDLVSGHHIQVANDGADTIINLDHDNTAHSLHLVGVKAASLQASDFILAA